MAGTATATRFATDWDTEPNPTYDIWTSVNGSEVVPGVLCPLVATTFNRFDYIGLRRLMATYPNGDKATLAPPPAANFFGVFGGRLALNNGFSVAAVSALDADIAQAILQQFFTGASGGERFIVDSTIEERAEAAATAAEQRKAAPAVLAGWRAALYAERATGRGRRDLDLNLADAWQRWNELFDESFSDYLNLHYIVSVAAADHQVRLGGIIQAGGGDPNVVIALCSGLGEVESSQPAVRLYGLAEMVRDRPALRDVVENENIITIRTLFEEDATEVGDAYRSLLFEYGYRGQGEADPSNADWSEDPTFALSQVRSMLAVPAVDSPLANIARAVERRAALEPDLRASLAGELRDAFDEQLAAAQHFTRMRELSKATWVLASRRLRSPFLAISRGVAEAGVVRTADDARFLTYDEVDTIVAGGTVSDAQARVEHRRAQSEEAEHHRLPDNWVGEPTDERLGEFDADVRVLTGLGVSVGDGPVTGTARIVPSAEAGFARDLDPGDVLVAPFTDAPWTPLFVVAGAVVVETGGVLSHAATVAREFGIPAVVMVKDATRVIHDGDEVTVDAAAGTVTITR
ncbi:MAG: rifampicin phosphotransferase [Acidimicrobiaceae bacterium]